MNSLSPNANIAQRARRRIFRRLMPFLFLLYLINYLDRINVSYAALSMAPDLGFINCIGSIGGFVGPYAVGYLNMRTGSSSAGLAFLTVAFCLGAVLLLFVRPARGKAAC